MKLLLTITAIFLLLQSNAQKREEGFDYNFKLTDAVPRYYVVTERRDSGWYREAWYLPERTQAMNGWYKDEKAEVPDGPSAWYYVNRFPRELGRYVDGKKHGTWLSYNEEGMMIDSANYEQGMRKGISMGWYPDGMPSDSTNFDGKGNGVVVEWHQSGNIKAAGYMVNDTAKAGIWNYYHENGTVMAKEKYTNGEMTSYDCYDESGKQLSPDDCKEEDASFGNGEKAWSQFVGKTLSPAVPVNSGAPLGTYTVVVQFVVDTDGKVMDIEPATKFGFGMEEEVVRMLKKSPQWKPAQQHGRKVKAYRRQPITFVVSNG